MKVAAALLLVLAPWLASEAGAQTFKIAQYNVQSGKGIDEFAGHTSSFARSDNCSMPGDDLTQPLNAWGTGFFQQHALAPIKNDPAVVAMTVQEAWHCASPERIRQELGWVAKSSEFNGTAIVARYGFKTATTTSVLLTTSGDEKRVVHQQVCLDAACTQALDVFSAHWSGGNTNGDVNAQESINFMGQEAGSRPHVMLGDLNVWEDGRDSSTDCGLPLKPAGLDRLRTAGYRDAWRTLHPDAVADPGYTFAINRAQCVNGDLFRRLDFAWSMGLTPQAVDFLGKPAVVGDEGASDHIGIIVTYSLNPLPPDSVPPTASSPSPTGGTVRGSVSVAVNAQDDSSGIARVDLLRDGAVVGSATTSPYTIAWDTTTDSNGAHTLTAAAYDRANNRGDSAPVNVTVDNTSPPTTGESVLAADNFDDNALASTWTANALVTGAVDPSVAVAEKNGRIEIGPLNQNDSGSSYNGLRSNGPYNFAGGSAIVQLVQRADANDANAFAMFAVGANSNNFYRWYLAGSTLVAEKKINGVKSSVASVAYSVSNQQYLRIRHDASAGRVVWETAPDTGNGPGGWTTQASDTWDATLVPLGSIDFEVKAGTTGVQPVAPGTVAFDNLRATVPVAESVALTDGFGGTLDTTSTWSISVLSGLQDSSIPVAAAGGALQIGPLKQNTTGSHYNGILSKSPIDLTGAYAWTEVRTVPDQTTHADAMLTLPIDGSNHYRIYLENGVLSFEKKLAGAKTVVGSVPYDPANHGFWRIRHDAAADQIVFETAQAVAGGPGAWTRRVTVARELAITALKYELKAGTSQAETTPPGSASFDNVRVAK